MFFNQNNQGQQSQQGNLQQIVPLAVQSMGALGGFGGGGSGFAQGFNSAYGNSQNSGNQISLSPLISGLVGQSNFSRLNTLGGLVPPISGGLY